MAKQKVKAMVGIIIALVIGGVLIGYLLPIGVSSVNQPDTVNQTQDVGTTYQLKSGLINSTVDSVTDATDATITLEDTESGTTEQNTINVGSTTEYTLPGGNVNVTVNSASSGSPGNASLTYEIPNDYGWGDGAQGLYGLLPLFIVLVPLVVVVGWAMRSM
jgi:hypothetical protein